MKFLITGASGFIGSALVARALRDPSLQVSAAVRHTWPSAPPAVRVLSGAELSPDADWRAELAGQEVVVHAAALVHVDQGPAARDLAAFRRVNVAGTLNLARQAAAAGVRRFVFVSSIGVNGTRTYGRAFTADSPAAPHSAYAVSKHEAEVGLRVLAARTGLEVVIVRPPLVIGPGAPGNVRRMFRVMARALPLPLGAIRNRRSLVALDNLNDLLLRCTSHPAAVNRTFLVSDGEDLSTTELLRRVAEALGRPARLVPVPTPLLRTCLSLLGGRELARQLCQSLQVDIRTTQQILGWSPPVTLDHAILATAQHFLHTAD